MDERVKSQSKRLCTWRFFFFLYLVVVLSFSLPQSSTLTKAMQIVRVQSSVKMADCLGLFSAARFFFLNEVFSAAGVFSPEEGVGPPLLNHTLVPAVDFCVHMQLLRLRTSVVVTYVMFVQSSCDVCSCCVVHIRRKPMLKGCHCGHLAWA